jgi:hypothetical protein
VVTRGFAHVMFEHPAICGGNASRL